jgi:hypothetical protein
VKPFRGGEAFLAADGDVRLFDGYSTKSLGGGELLRRTRDMPSGRAFTAEVYCRYHAGVCENRDEYVLFRGLDEAPTYFWVYQPEGDRWWPCQSVYPIGAMSDVVEWDDVTPAIQSVFGVNLDLDGTGPDVTAKLYFYSEEIGQEDSVENTDNLPTFYVETDDLDLSQPITLQTPHSLWLWAADDVDGTVSGQVRTAQATSYTAPTVTLTPTAQVAKRFDFLPSQAGDIEAATAHRFKLSGAGLRNGIFALLLRLFVGGEQEMT